MAVPTFASGIAEITATTGTGAYALGGAIPGYAAFAGPYLDGAELYYRVTNGAQTERGRGIFDAAANTISRTAIAYPTSGPVNWSAGRKFVFAELGDDPAEYAPVQSVAGQRGAIILTTDDIEGLPEIVATVDNQFFFVLQTAMGTVLGDLDPQFFMPNIECGSLAGCGDGLTSGFDRAALGRLR